MKFNNEEDAFIIINGKSNTQKSIHILADSLKYLKPGERILTTIYNLSLIPFHYYFWGEKKLLLPLIPLNMHPSFRMQYEATKNLFTHKAKNNSLNLLGGSFKFNREKQLESVLEKAPNRFLRFFCKIATEDKRIKK